MKKRIISIALTLLLLVSAVYILPEPVSAASKTSFTTMESDYDGKPREKVGKYYIWVEYSYDAEKEQQISYLKCKKSLKKKARTIKTIKAGNKAMDSKVVTNGSTIFYSVSGDEKATIYKTTVKGGKSKAIKTVKGAVQLGAYYNGRIYYTHINKNVNLMSYSLSKKKVRTEKKNYLLNSSYGRYMTGTMVSTGKRKDGGSPYQYLYNAKSRKSKKLPKASRSVISGNKIYYWCTSNQSAVKQIKESNLSGKKVKTIKKIQMECCYFGKNVAYFWNHNGKVTKKLVYKTRKLTNV